MDGSDSMGDVTRRDLQAGRQHLFQHPLDITVKDGERSRGPLRRWGTSVSLFILFTDSLATARSVRSLSRPVVALHACSR